MKENEATTMVSSMNLADADSLSVRLDTSQILQQLDLFLRGKAPLTRQNEDGSVITELVDTGAPVVNDKGRQAILMWASNLINPTTIQGNTCKKIDFDLFIADLYEEFTDDVVMNCTNWEIEDGQINMIISHIMGLTELALSRTIENQERKLFGMIKEALSSKQKSSGFTIGGGA